MTMSDVLSFLEFAVWSFCAVAVGVTLARLAAMAVESDHATRVCRWIVKRGSPPASTTIVDTYHSRKWLHESISQSLDDAKRAPAPPPKPEPTKRKRGKR